MTSLFARTRSRELTSRNARPTILNMAFVLGTLNAWLLPNGTVRTCFAPETGVELRPMLAKNLGRAEQDFIRPYRLSPAEATAFRERIEREGCASLPATF